MLAVLIGGAAAGIPGALVATPIVGSAKRIYFEIRGRAEGAEARGCSALLGEIQTVSETDP